MSNIKISEMTEATTLNDSDLLTIVQGGTNKKITKQNAIGDIITAINNPTYTTTEGTDLTINNTRVGNIKLEYYGNTSQTTTIGYQLFQKPYIEAPSTNVSDINASLTEGTYTLATCDGNNFGTNAYIRLYKNGNVVTQSGHLTSSQITTFSSTTYFYVGANVVSYITFRIDDDYDLNIGLLNATGTRQVVLVSGSTINRNYEPFTERET